MTSCIRSRRTPASAPVELFPGISLLPDQHAIAVAGAEIDIDAADSVAVKAEELGVAEFLAVIADALVGHECLIALFENSLDDIRSDGFVARPAPLEIAGLVDGVVI